MSAEEILEETRSYKETARRTGLSITALRSRNSRHWKIQITPWSSDRITTLIRLFPTTMDKELASQLNVSLKSLQIKARRLGLLKSATHRAVIQKENSKKISSGQFRHQFGEGSDHPGWKANRESLVGRRSNALNFSRKVMKQSKIEQKNCCAYCLLVIEAPSGEYDHHTPAYFGGGNSKENCQLLCIGCHKIKTSIERSLTNNWKNRPAYNRQAIDEEIILFIAKDIE
jgi:5-methylcytosine-specific restriction endonuclease McrA